MPSAPLPANEAERLASLRSYEILDTLSEQAYDDIANLAARLTGCPMALVTLIDADRQWFKARVGFDLPQVGREVSFCAHTILGSELVEVPDLAADPRFADNPLVTGEAPARFYAGVPLINPEGFALGTLCVIGPRPRHFSGQERAALTALAQTAATTLELHRALRRVRAMALTDALTGLANRPALLDALERCLARLRRYGEAFALMYFDLDGFKAVNDTLGHAAGDEVLREVARVLRDTARREDIAARIGGDEFALVLESPSTPHYAEVAERLRAALQAAMQARGWAVTASAGAVRFLVAPDSADRALTLADQRMYAAKAAGKNQVRSLDFPAA